MHKGYKVVVMCLSCDMVLPSMEKMGEFKLYDLKVTNKNLISKNSHSMQLYKLCFKCYIYQLFIPLTIIEMKKITLTLIITFLGAIYVFSQVPQAFKYQAIARDSLGNIIANQLVSFRIGLIKDSINGTLIYSETHSHSTSQFGLVVLEIGTGTVEIGDFESIDWGAASYFLKVEFKEIGNASYQLMGTSQLLAVPYALQAKNVINDKDEQTFAVSGDTLFISNGNYVVLPGVSPIVQFNICGDMLTDIDFNTYNTVQIGSQCWMAENLKTTKYRNGTLIPNVIDTNAWSNLTTGAYVWYDNDISWKDSYGALYNWYAAVDANGLCPTGWHLPTDEEWTVLINFVGGASSPHGNELKSCRQVNSPLGGDCNTNVHPRWSSSSSNWGTDDYGFSCLPGGYRFSDGTMFSGMGNYGSWWSFTEYNSLNASLLNLYYFGGMIDIGLAPKRMGASIRCIKD